MKIQTECVPCLIKRIIFEAEQSTDDKKKKTKLIKETSKLLSELYDPDVCSATIATKIHKLAYEILQDDDPYEELKFASNKIAISILPRVKHLIRCSDDSLRIAMLSAIIGNLMDFGIEGGSDHPEKLSEVFEEVFVQDLGHDDSEEVKNILKKSKKVMLFTDNCGEIVFDRLLCREIKKFYPDVFLTLVVKGEPILSDATMQDALELEFNKVVDEILTTGCFAVGVDFTRLPIDTKERLEEADLIICKGMANYEAFSETDYKPVAYLLRTKCTAIANSMGLELNINAVKLYK
jgi:uncharacterized protein with ATP-grasp and redox domains